MYEINIGLAPWKYNKLQIFSFPPHQIRSNEERGSIQVRGNNTEQNKLRGNFAPSLYERKEKKNWSKGSLKITKVQIFPHSQPRFFLVNKTKIQNYPFKRSTLLIVIRLRCGRTKKFHAERKWRMYRQTRKHRAVVADLRSMPAFALANCRQH